MGIVYFLILEVNKLYKDKNLLFNKFLLERYLGGLKFKKEKIVDIMLKNKVVTTENIKILSDSGKIEVSNINELITKYTEA